MLPTRSATGCGMRRSRPARRCHGCCRTVTATTVTWSQGVHAQAASDWAGARQPILEEASRVSLGVSIFLLVVGAILTFAVEVTTSGFNLNTVGIILMIAGALGLVLSLLFWSSFSPYRRSRTVAGPDTVVEERRIERDLPQRRSALARLGAA